MTSNSDHDRRRRDRGRRCRECAAARAADQRYCLACGARFGPVPAAIAALLRRRAPTKGAKPEAPQSSPEDKSTGWPHKRSSFMPSPRAAAAAVIGMLALGVAIGSATDKIAQGSPLSTILLEESPPPPEEEPASEPTAEPEAEEPEEEAAPAAAPSAIPTEEPVVKEPLPEEATPKAPALPEEEPPAGLPEIKHIFVVMLGENGFEETFGKASTSKYLSEELPAEGEVLPNYFAVTSGELANQIAVLSGQGPTAETAAGCPNYGDVVPGTESAEGQIEGNGCVYPATTKSLPQQLSEKGLKWRAYVDEAEPCAPPVARNPFVYFHSVIDSPECAEADQPLTELSADLKLKPEKFPAFAYVSKPADPATTEEFLRTVVGEIKESLAYKDGGLLVVTSAEARQVGEEPDTSSCCVYPAYPNLPAPASEEPVTGPTKKSGGGGQVGAILLSPFIEPGTSSETYFNHYSLLATIEEMFALERIGYAAEPAITGFDESIFNASS